MVREMGGGRGFSSVAVRVGVAAGLLAYFSVSNLSVRSVHATAMRNSSMMQSPFHVHAVCPLPYRRRQHALYPSLHSSHQLPQCPFHRYFKSFYLGVVRASPFEVLEILQTIAAEWSGIQYHLIFKAR